MARNVTRQDLTGRIFGKWEVLEYAGVSRLGKRLWKCRCQCGSTSNVEQPNLLAGLSKKCLRCRGPYSKDITGHKYGKWTAIERVSSTRWKVQCQCGKLSEIERRALLTGRTTQCNACARAYVVLLGQKFGKWTVVGRIPRDECKGNRIWLIQCECGTIQRHSSHRLTSGDSLQCGICSRLEKPTLRIRPYEALYRKALRSARRDGHQFAITYEEFVALARSGECHYCVAPLSWAAHFVAKNGQRYQLDRKNNALGYVGGNLVPCCKRCNHAKGNRFTYEEWYGMTEYFRKQKNQ